MKKLISVLLAMLMLCGGLAVLAGAVDTYILTYDLKGGENGPFPQFSIPAGTTVTLSSTIPHRAGYAFKGWSATDGGTEAIESIEVNENTTVYAIWEAVVIITPPRDKIFDFMLEFFEGAAEFAGVMTWIVRYIFFGWLWGQLL